MGLSLGLLKAVMVCISPPDTVSHTSTHLFNESCQKLPWRVESRGLWAVAFWNRPVEMVVRTFLDTEGEEMASSQGKRVKYSVGCSFEKRA